MMRWFRFLLGLAALVWAGLGLSKMPEGRWSRFRPQEKLGIGAFLAIAVLCVLSVAGNGRAAGNGRKLPAKVGKGVLDTVLLMWTPDDPYTARDFVGGGICILGKTGSAKTSSSGYQIGKALVGALPKSGGLILASKPEDKAFWQRIFAATNRSDDLLIFEPGGPLRFNPIATEMKAGADSFEITRLLMTVGETLRRGSSRGGSNEAFWESQKERTFYNAIEIVRKATGSVSVPELARFIGDAATSEAQLVDENWWKGVHCEYVKRAKDAPKTETEQYDFEQCADFWFREWPKMDPKVRSSVMADIMGTVHTLNSGEVRQLLSTITNVSPATMEQGKWILVNTPVHEKGAGGLAIMAAWKYATERHVLRRHVNSDTSPIIIWCDEFQNVCNRFDSTFISEARSHMSAMAVLTQSIHSFHSAMSQGGGGDHEAKALLSQFGLRVFHALGDAESAKFASELVGSAVQQRSSFSRTPGKDLWEEMMGDPGITFSSNEHKDLILEPREFMQGLRTGGEANGCVADAIIVKSGEPFAWGGNYIRATFSQR